MPDYDVFLFIHKYSKIPHMCQTWWQGVMFVVAVPMWWNLTGDPLQTRHQGISLLAWAAAHCTAAGKLSGTCPFNKGGTCWKEKRPFLYNCSASIQHAEDGIT